MSFSGLRPRAGSAGRSLEQGHGTHPPPPPNPTDADARPLWASAAHIQDFGKTSPRAAGPLARGPETRHSLGNGCKMRACSARPPGDFRGSLVEKGRSDETGSAALPVPPFAKAKLWRVGPAVRSNPKHKGRALWLLRALWVQGLGVGADSPCFAQGAVRSSTKRRGKGLQQARNGETQLLGAARGRRL